MAHELCTPLAARTLIANNELALLRPEQADIREVLVELEELHRLTGIVNDMLFLSQADRGVERAVPPWRALHQMAVTYWTTTRPHCPRQVSQLKWLVMRMAPSTCRCCAEPCRTCSATQLDTRALAQSSRST